MGRQSLAKLTIIFLLLTSGFFQPLTAKDKKVKKGSQEWHLQGPKKTWSEYDHKKYYDWREGIYRTMAIQNDDPQVLRRQKAIMNGNKILRKSGTMDLFPAQGIRLLILFGKDWVTAMNLVHSYALKWKLLEILIRMPIGK